MISRILTIIPVRENSEVVTSYPDLCIYEYNYIYIKPKALQNQRHGF